MQEVYSGETIVSQIAERVSGSARVETVYGEARQVGAKTVIPVAKVEYFFGAGAGGGVNPSVGDGNRAASGGGGGGGGGVRVRPVGLLEVTEDGTRLVPVIDWTRIITTGIAVFGAWMLVRAVFRRRQ